MMGGESGFAGGGNSIGKTSSAMNAAVGSSFASSLSREFGARARLSGMGKAEAGQDFGGAGGCRMGADIGEPGLDVGNPMRFAGQFRIGQKLGALAVGFEHDLEQAFRTVGRLLREPIDAPARRVPH